MLEQGRPRRTPAGIRARSSQNVYTHISTIVKAIAVDWDTSAVARFPLGHHRPCGARKKRSAVTLSAYYFELCNIFCLEADR